MEKTTKNIDFNNLYKYSVPELEKIIQKLREYSKRAYKAIELKKLPDINFEGKFIKSEYGYMYVTWQTYCEESEYGDSRMFFQGIGFSASLGPYKDDSYFDYYALKEWVIPIETYKRELYDGTIQEITKEEFFNELNKYKENLFSEIENWINKAIDNNKIE